MTFVTKKAMTSLNHSDKGTSGFFLPNSMVVTKPSSEMNKKADKVTTFPQPGSSLTKSSKNITALQQLKNVIPIFFNIVPVLFKTIHLHHFSL